MKLSTIAETLPGSQILAISNAIKERIKKGETIYNFTVGDFDPQLFPIPELMEREIITAYRDRFTNYPAADGNLDLRETIVNFYNEFYDVDYAVDEVQVASGGRPLIYALYRTLIDTGDTIIYPVPSWNNHYYTQMVGGVAIEIETTADNLFMPVAEQIAPHVESAVLLALCSPQNPTGTSFKEKELKEICELVVQENARRTAQEKKLYVLYDQMYRLLNFGNIPPADPVAVCPAIKPYLIYMDAASKSFAATGVRVGWAVGPAPILQKMKAILTHVGAWAPMAEQKGVAKFLQNSGAVINYLQYFNFQLQQRLQLIYDGIIKLKADGFAVDAIEPTGAIYLAVKIDFPDAHTFLLNEAGIGILPFAVFGATNSNWYRISVGTCKPEDIQPMLFKLKMALHKKFSYANTVN